MKLLVSAIEPSANIHLKELKKHLSDDVEFIGLFDSTLGNPLEDLSSMAVMGFVDAIKKIKYFLNLKKQMVTLAKDADKVLLMDSSGFNLPLAKELKKTYPNLEIIYYILPQAWAWRKGRIKTIEQVCDKLYSILPFEQNFYTKKEKIKYVGHPLLDEIQEFKTTTTSENSIVYMPGSRRSEIKRLMPVFRQVSQEIGTSKKHILVIPKNFLSQNINDIYGDISSFEISFEAHQKLYSCEFAFICSGTATLEAALIGTPFTLAYIAKKVDFFIGKHVIKIDKIGLANIFFDKMDKSVLHNELLQEDVTVSNLLFEYNNKDSNRFLEKSFQLRNYLSHGSSKVVANLIENK